MHLKWFESRNRITIMIMVFTLRKGFCHHTLAITKNKLQFLTGLGK